MVEARVETPPGATDEAVSSAGSAAAALGSKAEVTTSSLCFIIIILFVYRKTGTIKVLN